MTTLSHNKTSPKWSMGGRSGNVAAKRPTTPGPGAYQHGRVGDKKPPSYGFGTSQRELARTQSAPGPGQYAPMDRHKSGAPQFGFGTSARDGGGGNAGYATPGPGAYAPNGEATRRGAPKYTATPRRDGASGRGAVAGGLGQSTPGPGAYNSTHKSEKPKAAAWGFGTAARSRGNNQSTPGPGSYHNKPLLGTEGGHGGPKFSMRSRAEQSTSQHVTPGPGGYGGHYTQFS